MLYTAYRLLLKETLFIKIISTGAKVQNLFEILDTKKQSKLQFFNWPNNLPANFNTLSHCLRLKVLPRILVDNKGVQKYAYKKQMFKSSLDKFAS